MKNNEKTVLPRFIKSVLDILFVLGIVVFIVLSIQTLMMKQLEISQFKKLFMWLLFFTGISSLLLIIYDLRRIIDSVIKETPFIWRNVRSIKRISISCFIISVCYIINFFACGQYKQFSVIAIDEKGIHTDTEFLIFFFAGCVIFILSQVFKSAVKTKEENDLTI